MTKNLKEIKFEHPNIKQLILPKGYAGYTLRKQCLLQIMNFTDLGTINCKLPIIQSKDPIISVFW